MKTPVWQSCWHNAAMSESCKAFAILEQARVRRHFRTVVAQLRAAEISHLTDEQRVPRRELLDEVERYGLRGLFPKNRHSPDALAPTFIDEEGTRCAVAHLLERTGEAALAAEVARTRNYALVPELARDARLAAWMARAGFSVAETAQIQPTYCGGTKADNCVCEHADGVTGVYEGSVVSWDPVTSRTTFVVDAVHGDVGGVSVGTQLDFVAGVPVGNVFLVAVNATAPDMVLHAMRVQPDGAVEVSCSLQHTVAAPALHVQDAVTAILAGAGRPYEERREACNEALERVDSTWTLGNCEEPGCSAAGSGASPLIVGAALLMAMSRRRAAATRRRAAVARLGVMTLDAFERIRSSAGRR